MLQRLLIKAMISFVIGQIEKFREQLDWDKVRKNMDAYVRNLVPGTWFDEQAVKIVDSVFLAIKNVVSQGDYIKHILQLLAEKKYAEAIELVKQLVLGAIGDMSIELNEVVPHKVQAKLLVADSCDVKPMTVSLKEILA